MTRPISRKQFLVGAGAAAGALAAPAIATAAKSYTIKFGIDLPPSHPTTKHAMAAAKMIHTSTKGAVRMQVFPSSELGNDTHMLSEVRSGAIQMMGIGDNILATLVSACAIDNVGFAFKDAQTAYSALDGDVGDVVRGDIAKAGLHAMPRIWDEGFREITTSTKPIHTPDDLKGFKIRVPPSPISLSLFKDLGAAPATINVAELYTALQTGVVDGQENPLGIIETQKFYQVQKFCSLTNHMWVGYWIIGNGDYFKRLPDEYRKAVEQAFDAQAPKQRAANEKLNNSLQSKLTRQGLTFNDPKTGPFRQKLVNSGFYTEWQKKFGDQLWSALEKYTGKLG